ncbi:hypothetical protein ACIA5G_39150 [Amycolatopsis sp. NPDC051758]|uniref:hypothetical protein n=1 Tax=Amycolatopsis sp. NPDC051758 TaxID=3363935 RepID=UPI003794BDEE
MDRGPDPRLVVIPIVVVTVALVPAMILFPVLPNSRSRRLVGFLGQLRGWHTDVAEALAGIDRPDPAPRLQEARRGAE